ncbi:MAG: hypothetical protein WC477_04150 [Patescibacteria group bacterium]
MRIFIQPSINVLTASYGWNRTSELDAYKTKGHFSLFLLETMSRDSLPAFTYHGRKHPMQKTRSWYGNFDKDMKKVYAKHHALIKEGLKSKTCKEAKYFPKKLKRLLETFGNYTPPCSQVILCPNIFGVPGEGYGPLIGDTAYAVFTPDPKKDQTWLMVHEVCHSLLLPIFQSQKIRKFIKQTESLMEKWSTKKFRNYYPKWEWMIEEYCIHAIEQYATGSSIQEKMSWGMNRLPWFVKSWAEFQKRRKTNHALDVSIWIHDTLIALKSR